MKILYFHKIGQFQGIACYRLVSLHEILWILRKLTIFSDLHEIYAFSEMPYRLDITKMIIFNRFLA